MIFGAQAGMKSKPYLTWVLGALMAIASVDTVPDPPAVNPHTGSIASHLYKERGGVCERRRLTSDWSYSSHLQICWIAFTSCDEPNLPSDWMAVTGFAADSSPPALETRRSPYFHS